MELQSCVQNYDWGKLGNDSEVAKLVASVNNSVAVDPKKAYAELWVGTHPNGPSLLIERNVLLSEYIKNNVDAIGPDVQRLFGVTVPFLLKVLSVRKALSIQAHPNKEHAEQLHKDFPDLYKDPNHKPELAIALTPFQALCGFRPLEEIKYFVQNIEELQAVLTKPIVDAFSTNNADGKIVLKQLFETLMTQDKCIIKDNLQKFLTRLENEDDTIQSKLLFPLLSQLHTDYPGDVGCWSIYLLNYLQLDPGQAIFLAPNLPHAYLNGDCVECMACSDNVVRAGLTPKHIDVSTLVSMLDYGSMTEDKLLFPSHHEDDFSQVWRPPIKDFAVVKILIPMGTTQPYNTLLRASPSVLLVVSGLGTGADTEDVPLRRGTALFLKASRQLTLTVAPEATEDLVLYQAMCNVN